MGGPLSGFFRLFDERSNKPREITIDGHTVRFKCCGDCPVAEWYDDGLHCHYPAAPHEGFFGDEFGFPEDCPLKELEEDE